MFKILVTYLILFMPATSSARGVVYSSHSGGDGFEFIFFLFSGALSIFLWWAFKDGVKWLSVPVAFGFGLGLLAIFSHFFVGLFLLASSVAIALWCFEPSHNDN